MNQLKGALLGMGLLFVPLFMWGGLMLLDAYNQDYARCNGYAFCEQVVSKMLMPIAVIFGFASVGFVVLGYVVIDAIRTRMQVKKEAKA